MISSIFFFRHLCYSCYFLKLQIIFSRYLCIYMFTQVYKHTEQWIPSSNCLTYWWGIQNTENKTCWNSLQKLISSWSSEYKMELEWYFCLPERKILLMSWSKVLSLSSLPLIARTKLEYFSHSISYYSYVCNTLFYFFSWLKSTWWQGPCLCTHLTFGSNQRWNKVNIEKHFLSWLNV